MSASKSVQFDNAASVIEAYTNREIAPFAIFCGTQFMMVYEDEDLEDGRQLLDGWLQSTSKSAAIYTLKVYKKVPLEGINEKTLCSGSFNYRQMEKPMGYLPPELHREYGGSLTSLLSELQNLKVEIAELKRMNNELSAEVVTLNSELDEMESQGNKDQGMVGKVKEYVQIFEQIAPFLGLPTPGGQAARIAGVPGEQDPAHKAAETQISTALQVLCAADPEFPLILVKLAALAQRDRQTFAVYMKQVKSLL